ncbi:hypothetical protein F8388_003403 [Cannabis sativa]|uniref:Uncharacterized protein n=1 Tax=Cannabis sativa TaxID=3483 RepID=A0A7J6E4I4_CANSA|nr:hypothetical protein F8388_003403 [Cannabis sativa]
MDLEHRNSSSDDDQHFLLHFIMGMYLGPDVTFDNPRRSAFQRVSEDSPPYTSSDLGSSYVSIVLLENLYYYVLRKAHPSLRLKPNMFHKYLKGIAERWRFTSLFPLDLHEQIWFPASFRIVKGVVLINDPVMSSMEQNDLNKFKVLSCISDFRIEMDELLHYEHENQHQHRSNGEKNCVNGNETMMGGSSSEGDYLSLRDQHKLKRRRECDPLPMPAVSYSSPMAKHHIQEGDFQRTCIFDGQAVMSIHPLPELENCTSEPGASIAISGTARKGKVGPPVGVVDVGVSKDAYYFRVALPGVRKDYCKFSCEIESDGKVHVEGLVSGGKSIKKPLRIFEMNFQQLCPPGPFTLSFSLPGPVDPRLFAPNFRSDGIFEGEDLMHIWFGSSCDDLLCGIISRIKRKRIFVSMDAQKFAENPQMEVPVVQTGTAKEGSAGPPVGLIDVGESEGAYLFRVALPGNRKDQCNIKCEIERDGRVQIEGVMNNDDVGLMKESSTPDEPFNIWFRLPGPVDPRLFSPSFQPFHDHGILEGVVMKHTAIPPQQLS